MSELTYERAKQLYTPYDEGQMRHLCALRDVEIDRLRVENAKLRELVHDMFGAYKGTVEMFPSSYSKNVAERAVMDISDRMRKLGVEVNE